MTPHPDACRATSFDRPRRPGRRVRGEVHRCAHAFVYYIHFGSSANPVREAEAVASCPDVSVRAVFQFRLLRISVARWSVIFRGFRTASRVAKTISARSLPLTCIHRHPLQHCTSYHIRKYVRPRSRTHTPSTSSTPIRRPHQAQSLLVRSRWSDQLL